MAHVPESGTAEETPGLKTIWCWDASAEPGVD